MEFKPIETEYNGYRFRSRAEARWAVFFDNIGMRYIFEPEGYELSDGTKYLPDFYLPDSDSFFEVKGIMNEKDMHKIEMLINDLGISVAIGYADLEFQSCDWWGDNHYSITVKEESVLVKCKRCEKFYFSALNGTYACRCCGAYDGDHLFDVKAYGEKPFWMDYEKEITDAYSAAKQARFEHGETPNIKDITWKRVMRSVGLQNDSRSVYGEHGVIISE